MNGWTEVIVLTCMNVNMHRWAQMCVSVQSKQFGVDGIGFAEIGLSFNSIQLIIYI